MSAASRGSIRHVTLFTLAVAALLSLTACQSTPPTAESQKVAPEALTKILSQAGLDWPVDHNQQGATWWLFSPKRPLDITAADLVDSADAGDGTGSAHLMIMTTAAKASRLASGIGGSTCQRLILVAGGWPAGKDPATALGKTFSDCHTVPTAAKAPQPAPAQPAAPAPLVPNTQPSSTSTTTVEPPPLLKPGEWMPVEMLVLADSVSRAPVSNLLVVGIRVRGVWRGFDLGRDAQEHGA